MVVFEQQGQIAPNLCLELASFFPFSAQPLSLPNRVSRLNANRRWLASRESRRILTNEKLEKPGREVDLQRTAQHRLRYIQWGHPGQNT